MSELDKKPWLGVWPLHTRDDTRKALKVPYTPEVDGTKQPMTVYKDDGANGVEYSYMISQKSFHEAKEACHWSGQNIFDQFRRSTSGDAESAWDIKYRIETKYWPCYLSWPTDDAS